MGVRITTESGAVYLLEPGRIKRQEGDDGNTMRQDDGWINLYFHNTPVVGRPMLFTLEPLAAWADWTQRTTTTVVSIEEYGIEEDGT